MTDNAITLSPDKEGKYELVQLLWQEEVYCQLRAGGETGREAYRQAFGDKFKDKTLDTKVSRLNERPEIQARIDEIKCHLTEEEVCKAEKRRKTLADKLYTGALLAVDNPKMGGLPAAVKVFLALGDMYGWMGPQRLQIEARATGPVGGFGPQEINGKLDKLLELVKPKEGEN